jgi:hypothetical protein
MVMVVTPLPLLEITARSLAEAAPAALSTTSPILSHCRKLIRAPLPVPAICLILF